MPDRTDGLYTGSIAECAVIIVASPSQSPLEPFFKEKRARGEQRQSSPLQPFLDADSGKKTTRSAPASGVGALHLARGTHAFTGHTAIGLRIGSKIVFLEGFVPEGLEALLKTVQSYVQKPERPDDERKNVGPGSGAGHWQDDKSLLKDPTSRIVEFPIDHDTAASFTRYFASAKNDIKEYTLRPWGDTQRNCVGSAINVLIDFFHRQNEKGAFTPEAWEKISTQINRVLVDTAAKETCAQGELMKNINNWKQTLSVDDLRVSLKRYLQAELDAHAEKNVMGLFDEKLVVAARLLEETLMLFEHGNPKTDEEKNQYYSRMANLVAAIDVYAKENPVSSRLIGPISSETGWNRIKHDYNLVVNVAQTNMHNFYLQIIREEKRAEMPNVMAIELNVKSQALFRALNHAREAANAKVGFNSDKPRLLASEQARRWYKEYINTGIEFVKNNYGGQSLENQAKLAFAVRHGARVEARDLMDNSLTWCIAHVRDLASYGNVDGPSFNSLIDQHRKNGLSSEQAFQKVLETSTKTNQLVDEWRLGSENEALLQKQSEMLPMPEAQPEKVLNVQQSFK